MIGERTEHSWQPCPTPESVWAVSVETDRPVIVPMDAPAVAEERVRRATLPWWFPTPLECLAGGLFGLTIGLLVMAAVALDMADYAPPPPAAAGAAHAHKIDVAPKRPLTIVRPATALVRAPAAEELAASPPAARGAKGTKTNVRRPTTKHAR